MSDAPVRALDHPCPVDVESGTIYYWCACGRSQKQPFCDGSHKGTDITPLAFAADNDETLFFCGCKATDDAPFCDGSHKR